MVLFIFSAPDWYHKMSISLYKPLISNISWFSDNYKSHFSMAIPCNSLFLHEEYLFATVGPIFILK